MSSTLDRLRQAAAANTAAPAPETTSAPAPAAAAPAPAAPPVQAAAAPMTPADAAQAAQGSIAATVVTPTPAPAAQAPEAAPVAAPADTQLVVTTADEAARVLGNFFGGVKSETSLANIAEDIDEGGVREEFPFATVKKGNWRAYDKIPQAIFDVMPVGDRPYRMVYLAHRIGALAWIGSGDAGSNKQPPAWSAAAPVPSVSPLAADLNRRLMKIGSKVQYTAGDKRVKFDGVGRLQPEIHVFGWRPDTGFIVLVCSTFKATELSLNAFANIEGKGGVPIMLSLGSEHQHNPRATDPKKANWDVPFLKPDVVIDEAAQKLAVAFDELRQKNTIELANACMKFARGDDYKGLNTQELVAKLDQYNALI